MSFRQHRFFAQVPIQRRPADPEVLGDVPPNVTVGLHPLGGGVVLRVVHLPRPTDLGAVGTGRGPLQGGTLLDQLAFVLRKRAQDADHHASSSGG